MKSYAIEICKSMFSCQDCKETFKMPYEKCCLGVCKNCEIDCRNRGMFSEEIIRYLEAIDCPDTHINYCPDCENIIICEKLGKGILNFLTRKEKNENSNSMGL